METKKVAHVVLVPYPSQGHINPLLQFSKRLASKGLRATVATTHYTVASICAPGVSVEPISDGFDAAGYSQAGSEENYVDSFRTNGSRTLSEVVLKYESSDSPVRCIVYDSFLPWALDVAKRHGLYGAAFFTNSVAVSSIFCRIHHGEVALPVEAGEETPLVLPSLPPLKSRDLPTFLRYPESYPAYLAMKLRQFSNVNRADWIFSNSFQGLEATEAKGIRELWPAKLIGPMVPSGYLDECIKGDRSYGSSLWKPLREECLEWLESKPPRSVAYIAFGSMVSFTQQETEEMAWGLKESNVDFLWVVRDSEAKKLPQWFKEEEKGGMVVSWCSQMEVLAHPAIGCFMTHCGWNSTLEALSLGVPMVGVPKWADQLTDAKYLSEVWGVGVRAAEDENGVVRRGEVVRCLKEVMEGARSEEIRQNAGKWREVAKKAVSQGGSSDNCINHFVNDLLSQ